MDRARRRHIIIFITLNLSVLVLAFIYNILFEEGLIGKCVFLDTFGLYCPGCGGSRSLNFLLKFDLINSFIYYPPIIITVLILLYANLRLLLAIIKKTETVTKIDYRLFLIIPVAIILNFVIRNILLFFGIDLLGNIL